MIRIDVATLFPQMCETILNESIIGRARQAGLIEVNCHNIRDYTLSKHNNVDDKPYGHGMGMLMQAEPIDRCFSAVCENLPQKPHTIYMSPQGKPLTQQRVKELSKLDNIFILCGHYEGVDERILEKIVDEEISIGDYVLTGGELPAMVLVDSIARLCDGVLSDSICFEEESHYSGLLEYPQYTRPEIWEGRAVPPILLSGHHANIEKWRHEKALERTFDKRPDMLEKANLSKEDIKYLEEYSKSKIE